MIETDFSEPPPKDHRRPDSKMGQIRQIKVGGSHFFQADTLSARKLWQSAAAQVGARDGAKYTTEKRMVNGKAGLRIWRIS